MVLGGHGVTYTARSHWDRSGRTQWRGGPVGKIRTLPNYGAIRPVSLWQPDSLTMRRGERK